MKEVEIAEAYEALTQFLYQVPIGLVQTGPDGEITMMNPAAAAVLVPLDARHDQTNLFDILSELVPHLAALVSGFPDPVGLIVDGYRFSPRNCRDDHGAPQTLALGLARLNSSTLIFVKR